MVNMGYYLTNLLFFDIPLLYYYIRYQIINNFLSFFWRYMSFFRCFSIFFISNCFWVIFCEFLETFVILSAIVSPIKSPVTSTVFWITLFEVVLSASVTYCLAWSRFFWLYLPLTFLLILFYQKFSPYF